MRRMREKVGRILACMVAFCLLFAMTVPAVASNTKGDSELVATDDPRESIMLMTLGYEDDAGTYTAYKGGTCFMINQEYVLTNKHVVTFQDGEFEDFKKSYDAVPDDLKITDKHLKLYLYVNRDMKVEATMHDSVNSDDMDFAAVKLAEKIYDRKPCALGNSSEVQTKDTVYAMGFPVDSISTKEYNTKEDVSTVQGAVSKLTVTGSVDVIEHTAILNAGNSGGPLLDENNHVIGVNTSGIEGKMYSTQIDTIKKALDTFGIAYVQADGGSGVAETETPTPTPEETEAVEETVVPEPTATEAPDNTAILNELQATVDEAKAIDTKGYTDDSVQSLDAAIGTAEGVLAKDPANLSEAEIQNTTDNLNNAMNTLEQKSGPSMALILALAAAVIVIIIIVIVIIVLSGKKKTAAPATYPTAGPTGAAPTAWGPSAESSATVSHHAGVSEGIGETTLLNDGTGDTTLLSGAGTAYLIRRKNGEKIPVNIQNFKIGKERAKVNYCISDNTSVSRIHCEITKKGMDYYVTDKRSTNFTFVNGVQLSPNRATILSDRSILKLSDEEFEFHLA